MICGAVGFIAQCAPGIAKEVPALDEAGGEFEQSGLVFRADEQVLCSVDLADASAARGFGFGSLEADDLGRRVDALARGLLGEEFVHGHLRGVA